MLSDGKRTANRERLDNVGDRRRCPADDEAGDDGDDRLQNVQLRVGEGKSSSRRPRLLVRSHRVLVTRHHRNVIAAITTTRPIAVVTTAQQGPVNVFEGAHWRNLANAIEPPDRAAMRPRQITLNAR